MENSENRKYSLYLHHKNRILHVYKLNRADFISIPTKFYNQIHVFLPLTTM